MRPDPKLRGYYTGLHLGRDEWRLVHYRHDRTPWLAIVVGLVAIVALSVWGSIV